jgi:hypothetical protein
MDRPARGHQGLRAYDGRSRFILGDPGPLDTLDALRQPAERRGDSIGARRRAGDRSGGQRSRRGRLFWSLPTAGPGSPLRLHALRPRHPRLAAASQNKGRLLEGYLRTNCREGGADWAIQTEVRPARSEPTGLIVSPGALIESAAQETERRGETRRSWGMGTLPSSSRRTLSPQHRLAGHGLLPRLTWLPVSSTSPTGSGHVLAHQWVDHEPIFGPRAGLTTGQLPLDHPHHGIPKLRRGHGSLDRDHHW